MIAAIIQAAECDTDTESMDECVAGQLQPVLVEQQTLLVPLPQFHGLTELGQDQFQSLKLSSLLKRSQSIVK